ncbi:deoxycytidine triphosphate deaminase [Mesorhizobium sp. M0208]|uniref:dCTP deaminase domain-containing protein n=1 Tax=unclassified Mesorhizobium TaxID=325217 RepID=UPI0033357FDF
MSASSTSRNNLGGGGFWSGEKLLANQSVVMDFDPLHIDANAYNLRMGNVLFKTAELSGEHQGKTVLAEKQCFLIPPGQFAFLLTKEEVSIPSDAMAFISMRTRIKYQGLINVSGFHVDPGYKGKLIYAVYNASPSPVQICEGDPAFKIWFCSLDRTSSPPYLYDGKAINDIDNELVRGMSKEILSLQGLSEKIRQIESDVDKRISTQQPVIDSLSNLWNNISLGVILALVGIVLTIVAPTTLGVGLNLLKKIETKWPVLGAPELSPPAQTSP